MWIHFTQMRQHEGASDIIIHNIYINAIDGMHSLFASPLGGHVYVYIYIKRGSELSCYVDSLQTDVST